MLPTVEEDSQGGVIRHGHVIGVLTEDFGVPGAPSPNVTNADVMQS